MTSRIHLTGASIIALSFLVHSFVLVVLEPAMGFHHFSDYTDLRKVMPALGSVAWAVSNVDHLVLGLGLALFTAGTRFEESAALRVARVFGVAASCLFVVVGMSGIVGNKLTNLMDAGSAETAILGLIGFRMTLLYAAVACFGALILALSASPRIGRIWIRVLGAAVGLLALLFPWVATPVPLLIFVWSVCYLILETRRTRLSNASA